MKSELDKMKTANSELQAQNEESAKQLSALKKANEALNQEKSEICAEMAKVRQGASNKTEHHEDMAAKHRKLLEAYRTLKGKHQEQELKVGELEEQLSKRGSGGTGATKSDVAVERWEKEKKLQRSIDSLKQKLAGKQEELDGAHKQIERLKSEVSAMSKSGAAKGAQPSGVG